MPLVKGSDAKCPYCGAKSSYMESKLSLKYYLNEILHIESIKKKKIIKDSEIERRKALINSFFSKLKSDFNEYRHLILTKLDKISIDPIKLYILIRSSGNFEIIIEKYLLTYLRDEVIRKKYREFRDIVYIINKSSLGLYFSYLARNSSCFEISFKYYQFVEKNYRNIVDFYNITQFENDNPKVNEKRVLYEILTEFAIILRGILNKNPKYYSKKLEDLLFKLNRIKAKGFHKYILYSQIESIYKLEHNTSVLLEKVKLSNPFLFTYFFEENFIYNTEENLKKINSVRNWIKNLSDNYRLFQANLLKLHSGRLINYLESYNTEFANYEYFYIKKFNRLLEEMIMRAFEVYNSEAVEIIKFAGDLLYEDIFNEEIIKKFEIKYNYLINLDESLKKFITNIFQKPLLRKFTSEYYKKLTSLISVKHSEFDQHILKFINRIFQYFEDFRSKNILSLEEQKYQFKNKIQPTLQKLLNLSFNLNESILSYPLFIDIKVQNKTLKQNNPETINLIIENPNLTAIKDIKIYFFMPTSFQSKLKSTSIKRLRVNERRKIKIKITPRDYGTSFFMVMAEYQHTNKTFWMPSIRLKFKVERVEQIVKHYYYRYPNSGFFQNEIDFYRINRFVKNYV
ncbi:MAG: hypothetical protein ACFFCE_06950 [Promethearchaeota archaeon]